VSVPILITAFCRPALTVDAVNTILKMRPDSEIVVSQDGRIPGFYESEHSMTRSALLDLSKNEPRIKLNLRDLNRGLTQHLIAVFQELFKTNDSVIFLEEDMRICHAGINYLESIRKDTGLSHRTSFSTTNHPVSRDNEEFRLSYFPEQWGISINKETFEAFVEEFVRKQIDRTTVRHIINQAGYGFIQREFLTDFWVELLRKEVNAPHGWDATLQWTLWKHRVPSKVSLKSHITDHGGEIGSITSRTDFVPCAQNRKGEHSIKSQDFCTFCEQQDAGRRRFSASSQFRTRLKIRSRIRNLVEQQRYR